MGVKVAYKTARQRKRDRYRTHRQGVREQAYALDGGRCCFPTCRRVVALASDDPWRLANAHEITRRSAGGDPTDLNIVVTVCFTCHMAMHPQVGGKTKRIEGTRAEGLVFSERQGEDWVVVQ